MNEEEKQLIEAIKLISRGVKRLSDGGLNERAIITLIYDNAGVDNMGKKPSKTLIRSILKSMQMLEQKYCK